MRIKNSIEKQALKANLMKVINKPTKGKDEQAEAGEEMKKDIVPKKSGI